MNVYVRTPTAEDISHFVANLSQIDRDKLVANYGIPDLKKIISQHVLDSEKVIVAGKEGQPPVLMFGCIKYDLLSNQAIIWFFTTKDFAGSSFTYLRKAKRFLDEVQKDYKVLFTYAYGKSCRMLDFCRFLGFKVDDAVCLGASKTPFNRIERRAKNG